MNIEIITTSNDTLKETGFGSNSSRINVLEPIERTEHTVRLTVCLTLDDLNEVVARKPDLVFLAAKYLPVLNGEHVWFSDYFPKHKITFSGSDRETLRFDSDKVLAKIHINNLGINTARHFIATPGQFKNQDDLPLTFPLFVKPSDAANGNGVDDLSFVNTFEEFEAKVLSIYKQYKQPALIEEYLSGREFTVAIICKGDGELITASIEILPPESTAGIRILGEAVKKGDTESLMKINHIEDVECINDLAKAAFLGLGVRGFGRIDVKMDSAGKCFFMEANLVPGMTQDTSYFPKACEIANNLTYDEVVCLMLKEGLDRVVQEKPLYKTFSLDTVNYSAVYPL